MDGVSGTGGVTSVDSFIQKIMDKFVFAIFGLAFLFVVPPTGCRFADNLVEKAQFFALEKMSDGLGSLEGFSNKLTGTRSELIYGPQPKKPIKRRRDAGKRPKP